MAAMTASIRYLIYLSCLTLVQCALTSYKSGDNRVKIMSQWSGSAALHPTAPLMSVLSNGAALLKEKLELDDDGLAAEIEVQPNGCLSVHLRVRLSVCPSI